MAQLPAQLKKLAADQSVRQAVLLFVGLRLLLSIWAMVAMGAVPVTDAPDEFLRPYLGETPLTSDLSGALLGPWQRFDGQHYIHIARAGYGEEVESVFPPLYPLAIRLLAAVLGSSTSGYLLSAIILSNVAAVGVFVLLHQLTASLLGERAASRAILYLAIFPTSFFLLAPYSESLFILLALGSFRAAGRERFWMAGILGFLAALTRLTGWILIVPLLYGYWEQRGRPGKLFGAEGLASSVEAMAPLLPAFGFLSFTLWRWLAGLPSLGEIYQRFWHQSPGIPGVDLFSAAATLFFGGASRANERIALSLDLGAALLLIISSYLAYRRLGKRYGLYSLMMLFFMLLPTSEVKPLYSFSRYALAFFPTFIMLAAAGRRPAVNRLIVYGSLLLLLYASAQFFLWGWIA